MSPSVGGITVVTAFVRKTSTQSTVIKNSPGLGSSKINVTQKINAIRVMGEAEAAFVATQARLGRRGDELIPSSHVTAQ